MADDPPAVLTAALADLDPHTLHALLRLRVDVFVVEQRCAYPELDDRDTDPATRHCWIADTDGVAAYLRVTPEPQGGSRIGRVVTARRVRGAGHAHRLVTHALGFADRPVVASAQSPLAGFYARFGFVPTGPEFIEDGIPHIPMRLAEDRRPRRDRRPDA